MTRNSKWETFKPREMPPTNPEQPSSSIRGLQRAVQEQMNVPTFAATATATATATGISSYKIMIILVPSDLFLTFSHSLGRTLTHSPCGDAKRRRPSERAAARQPEESKHLRKTRFRQFRARRTGKHEKTEKWLITAEKMVEGSDRK